MDFGSIYTTYILPTASLIVSILALLQAHRAARKSHRHWFPAASRETPSGDAQAGEERFVEHSRLIAMATGVLAGAVGASAITLALVRVGVDAPIIGTVLSD